MGQVKTNACTEVFHTKTKQKNMDSGKAVDDYEAAPISCTHA